MRRPISAVDSRGSCTHSARNCAKSASVQGLSVFAIFSPKPASRTRRHTAPVSPAPGCRPTSTAAGRRRRRDRGCSRRDRSCCVSPILVSHGAGLLSANGVCALNPQQPVGHQNCAPVRMRGLGAAVGNAVSIIVHGSNVPHGASVAAPDLSLFRQSGHRIVSHASSHPAASPTMHHSAASGQRIRSSGRGGGDRRVMAAVLYYDTMPASAAAPSGVSDSIPSARL